MIEKASMQALRAEPLKAAVLVARVLPEALVKMAETLSQGAKDHPPDDWREKGVLGNLDHAHGHELLFRHGDNQEEDNLAHGATRFMMALQLREEGKDDTTD